MVVVIFFKVVNLVMSFAFVGSLFFFCGGGEVIKVFDKKFLFLSLFGVFLLVKIVLELRVWML